VSLRMRVLGALAIVVLAAGCAVSKPGDDGHAGPDPFPPELTTPIGTPLVIQPHFLAQNDAVAIEGAGFEPDKLLTTDEIADLVELPSRSTAAKDDLGPTNGTVTQTAQGGAITYVPKPGFVGYDHFAYDACPTTTGVAGYPEAVLEQECTPAMVTVLVGTITLGGGSQDDEPPPPPPPPPDFCLRRDAKISTVTFVDICD
jgi:hypothetical protein